MYKLNNSKQYEMLSRIRNVGMSIIFGKLEVDEIADNFLEYEDFINDDDYSLVVFELNFDGNNGALNNPDTLLFKLGKFIPKIEYVDEDYNIDDLLDCIF